MKSFLVKHVSQTLMGN